MHTLTVKDLDLNVELDRTAATRTVGGWVNGSTYSTGDLHKEVYGDEYPPYGRYWPISNTLRFLSF